MAIAEEHPEKVICKSNRIYRGLPGTFGEPNHVCSDVTVGKVYEVIDSRAHPHCFLIEDDAGRTLAYPEYIFDAAE